MAVKITNNLSYMKLKCLEQLQIRFPCATITIYICWKKQIYSKLRLYVFMQHSKNLNKLSQWHCYMVTKQVTKEENQSQLRSYISYISFCDRWSSDGAEALPNAPHHSAEHAQQRRQFGQ